MSMIRQVRVTRYVTPLREGGSLPAIVEADDDGLYVLKFRGAGQGPLALVAEFLAAGIGRQLQLSIPEVVLMELGSDIGRNEPDQEIQDLLLASTGLNLGMDYLPGSVMFDQASGDKADKSFASTAVWFDAFITNVDRTAMNPNLLRWHNNLYLIDHGASLYFQHQWENIPVAAASRFAVIKKHVLLPWASEIGLAGELLQSRLSMPFFESLVDALPEPWLMLENSAVSPQERRSGYLEFFTRRLGHTELFVEEAVKAHAQLV